MMATMDLAAHPPHLEVAWDRAEFHRRLLQGVAVQAPEKCHRLRTLLPLRTGTGMLPTLMGKGRKKKKKSASRNASTHPGFAAMLGDCGRNGMTGPWRRT